MKTPIEDFDELAKGAKLFLLNELSYSAKTVVEFDRFCRQIKNLMLDQNITHFDQEAENLIIQFKFGKRAESELSSYEKSFYNALKKLREFQTNGSIILCVIPKKAPVVFRGEIGELINDFLRYKTDFSRLNKRTLYLYRKNLFYFQTFCKNKQITSFKHQVDLPFILNFVHWIDASKSYRTHTIISTLRGFMQYVFEQQITSINLAKKIPKVKKVSQPELPSIYSAEEIAKLINSIDRSSAVGKRNYAILLLAARLGLRASDIARLRFDQIQWDTNGLKLIQYKTGKELTLPLLADVGNALIDYLKYGRPSKETPYVFLTERPPCGPFTSSNVVTHVVQRAFLKAGISIKKRKIGPHSLRHSLSFSLLNSNTPLPIISEVLGHKSTESTRYYLRIDLHSMKRCMLNVPLVASEFYLQKNERFYEKVI